MRYRWVGNAVAVVSLVLPTYVSAQRTTEAHIGLGLEETALRNPAESPYRLAGWGPTFSLGVDRRSSTSALDVTLLTGHAALHSGVSGGTSRNGVAAVDIRYLRAVGQSRGRVSWWIGTQMHATADISDHQYNGSFGSHNDQFGIVASGLGATVRASHKLGAGLISSDLAVPLASWVDSPYANLKMNGDALRLQFASLGRLRAFDESISYRVLRSQRASIGWTYRLSYMQYASDDVRRFARQSLSGVITIRLSGREP